MAYIQTSKTRRRQPHGKTVVLQHAETGDHRICDERYAEKKMRRSGWSDPKSIPGVTDAGHKLRD